MGGTAGLVCLCCTVGTVTVETSRADCPASLPGSYSRKLPSFLMAFEDPRTIFFDGSDSKPYIFVRKMKFSYGSPQSQAASDGFRSLLSLPHIGQADAALPSDAVRPASAFLRTI